MIWVVVTNSNTCRIYNYSKSPASIDLLKTLEDPETKLKDSELVSDKPGHFKSGPAGRGAFEPETDPKENEINKFTRLVANEVDRGRKTGSFKELILIAPPHISGLLLQHLPKNTKEMVRNHIQKELTETNNRELLDFLHTHAQYSDNA